MSCVGTCEREGRERGVSKRRKEGESARRRRRPASRPVEHAHRGTPSAQCGRGASSCPMHGTTRGCGSCGSLARRRGRRGRAALDAQAAALDGAAEGERKCRGGERTLMLQVCGREKEKRAVSSSSTDCVGDESARRETHLAMHAVLRVDLEAVSVGVGLAAVLGHVEVLVHAGGAHAPEQAGVLADVLLDVRRAVGGGDVQVDRLVLGVVGARAREVGEEVEREGAVRGGVVDRLELAAR